MSASTHRRSLRIVLLAALVAAGVSPAANAAGPYQYHSITPCRIADTRYPDGDANCPFTGNCQPALQGNANQVSGRAFQVQGLCGVPSGAAAATLNITIVTPNMSSSNGFLTIWPTGGSKPTVSTINFTNSDVALANGAIVPLANQAGDLAVFFGGAGIVHLIVDVTGYFQ